MESFNKEWSAATDYLLSSRKPIFTQVTLPTKLPSGSSAGSGPLWGSSNPEAPEVFGFVFCLVAALLRSFGRPTALGLRKIGFATKAR